MTGHATGSLMRFHAITEISLNLHQQDLELNYAAGAFKAVAAEA
jgi:hypothetical protein